MKRCPYCAEEIQDAAIKCRFCGSFLTGSTVPQAGAAPAGAPAPTAGTPPPAQAPAPAAAPPLTPAVSTRPAPIANPSRRQVLYSGSPSWRAFFGEYLLLIIGTVAVPLLANYLAARLGAHTMARILAVLIPVAMAALGFVALHFYRTSKVFRVTTTNIESEVGLLRKTIDVMELWRCRDVRYQQSLLDRILGIAHIEVFTHDITTPVLKIVGVPASRQLFERIRDSIEIQRQARNVVGMVE